MQTEIEAEGGAALAICTDIWDQDQIDRALSETVDRFDRVDGVLANAGYGLGPKPFIEMTLDEWSAQHTNLTGTFLTLQAGARRLIAQGHGGSLIATGSSLVFRPHSGQQLGYVASKGGVHSIIRGLALEMAPYSIRVNAIAPGLTRTPTTEGMPGLIERGLKIVPLGETVDADELGALAAFMLSDDARHMTGSIVQLDAGRTAD